MSAPKNKRQKVMRIVGTSFLGLSMLLFLCAVPMGLVGYWSSAKTLLLAGGFAFVVMVLLAGIDVICDAVSVGIEPEK
jgi:membrane protein YdbS with pleckstrin-like domain